MVQPIIQNRVDGLGKRKGDEGTHYKVAEIPWLRSLGGS